MPYFREKSEKMIYEIELLLILNCSYKKLIDDINFKKFMSEELSKEEKRKLDFDVRIRDLYPIEIHTDSKDDNDVKNFYKIDDVLLSYNYRIFRRVTKKEIVYKKDKERGVFSIRIMERKGLRLYFSSLIEKFIDKEKLNILPETSRRPLNYELVFDETWNIDIIKEIIKNYLDEVFKSNITTNVKDYENR